MRKAHLEDVPHSRRSGEHLVPAEICTHRQVREIAKDFDKDGMLLILKRCKRCGLLIREYPQIR